jgi:murein DD-endopeptidase MepM/ murein hydrolase activator NlpD
MKKNLLWPVPDSARHTLQTSGAGSFWEDRGDRFHCGVDIYAPFGSDVVSMQDGLVVQIQLFTSPQMIHYWNETIAVTVQHLGGVVIRYAEMFDANVRVGESIR